MIHAEEQRRFVREIHQFYIFILKLSPPLGRDVGHEIYNFLSPYPTDATYQIWLMICSVVFEKKMLTHDARRTTTHSNR